MADKIDVQGKGISIISRERQDYLSVTDIAKYRNSDAPADIVKNWMRNRSTIEFLGLWEQLNNADFKLVEFDQFRNEAGANHFVSCAGVGSHLTINCRKYSAVRSDVLRGCATLIGGANIYLAN